jgi:predicted glutamine amidotransferase
VCELFSLSSRVPATVRLSLEELGRRGGSTGPHRDGWGIAYYADGDVQLLREPAPMADSACARFVQDHPFRTTIAIGHIRRATRGALALRNSQPFVRELGGSMHVFAHNGDLDVKSSDARLRLGAHRPVGETDSELAFCALLARLGELWRASGPPSLPDRLAVVSSFAADLRPLGPANFLYADGDALFAHGHARMHGVEGIRPPGLHVLCRSCASEPGEPGDAGLSIEGQSDQHVVLFASVPLTAEPGWRPLDAGEIVVARAGVVTGTAPALV